MEFQTLCKHEGIRQQCIIPNTSHQNGVAAQKDQSFVQSARAMLLIAPLPKASWEEVVATAY